MKKLFFSKTIFMCRKNLSRFVETVCRVAMKNVRLYTSPIINSIHISMYINLIVYLYLLIFLLLQMVMLRLLLFLPMPQSGRSLSLSARARVCVVYVTHNFLHEYFSTFARIASLTNTFVYLSRLEQAKRTSTCTQ